MMAKFGNRVGPDCSREMETWVDWRTKRILQMRKRMREGGRFFSEEEKRDEDDEENKIVAFRRSWESCYAEGYGSFDGTSKAIQSDASSSPCRVNGNIIKESNV